LLNLLEHGMLAGAHMKQGSFNTQKK